MRNTKTNPAAKPGRKTSLASMEQKIEKLTDNIQKTKSKYEADKEELNQVLKKRDELMKREILNALRKSTLTLEEVLDYINSNAEENVIPESQEAPECPEDPETSEVPDAGDEYREIAEKQTSTNNRTLEEIDREELKFFHEISRREAEVDVDTLALDRELDIWEKRIRTDCFSERDDYCD